MKNIKTIFLLLILNFSIQTYGQEMIAIDNVKAKFGGFSYIQITNGAGVGAFYEKYFAKSHRIGLETNFIIARGENEYPVYNYYYQQYMEKSDKKRLSFLTLNVVYKKVLFVDQIANNFRPFLSASFGPVIAFDPPNVPEISTRFKNIETNFAMNGTMGIGLDFLYSGDMGMSFFAGYNYLKFDSMLDPDTEDHLELVGIQGYEFDPGKKDFSSAIVRVSITRKF